MRHRPLRRLTNDDLDREHARTAHALAYYNNPNRPPATSADEDWIHEQTIALTRALKRLRKESLRRRKRRPR
jgi:hypothetical protein